MTAKSSRFDNIVSKQSLKVFHITLVAHLLYIVLCDKTKPLYYDITIVLCGHLHV